VHAAWWHRYASTRGDVWVLRIGRAVKATGMTTGAQNRALFCMLNGFIEWFSVIFATEIIGERTQSSSWSGCASGDQRCATLSRCLQSVRAPFSC
jgi:hypothetical protein